MPRSTRTRLSLLVLAVAAAVLFLLRPAPEEAVQTTVLPSRPAPPPAPVMDAYGLEVGAFTVDTREIRRGETFSALLGDLGVPAETAIAVAEAARPVYDVRHLRAGRTVRVYREGERVHHLVYEQDAVRFVRFDVRDAPGAVAGERAVTVIEREAKGVVESSLWNALAETGSEELTFALAEMYAWQIDFHRLQPGDRFSVVYEEQQVDGRAIGVGRIRAARFEHGDTPYFGFLFEGEDGGADYYDEAGGSLRKAFLKAPVKFSRVSSGYTKRRFHPVQKRWKAHLGTDYAAPRGTEIVATGDGVVAEARFAKYNGNYVKIRHNGTYTTGYLHMTRIADGIRPGTRVRQGDVIGYVGSTGLATGPHVCYRFWKDGVQVDSRREAIPPSHPVPDARRAAFEALVNEVMPRLADAATRPSA